MATTRRFDIGDELALRGIVRLLDGAGPGTVTIEIAGTGQRMTVMANSTGVELVASGKAAQGFTKAPDSASKPVFRIGILCCLPERLSMLSFQPDVEVPIIRDGSLMAHSPLNKHTGIRR